MLQMAPKLRIYLCKLQDELNNNLKEAVKMAKEIKNLYYTFMVPRKMEIRVVVPTII